MMTRRHIRIKVMQHAFAYLHNKDSDYKLIKKYLSESVIQYQKLYLIIISLMSKIYLIAQEKKEIELKKYTPNKEEIDKANYILNNTVFQKFISSKKNIDTLKDKKIDIWEYETKYVTIFYNQIKIISKEELNEENERKEITPFEQDKKILIHLYKNIIAVNDEFRDFLEDYSISWIDDISLVNSWMIQQIEDLQENKDFNILPLYKNNEDGQYLISLFETVIFKQNEIKEIIKQYTENWEFDRIARLDLTIIQVAICEFLYFESIPAKVTLNEYIEISKEYSTEKSSIFINGILNKIYHEFEKNNKLNKNWRGKY